MRIVLAVLAVMELGCRRSASRLDDRPVSEQAPKRDAPSGRDDVAVELVAAEETFCARAESGKVYCWGYGANGELGNGATETTLAPVRAVGIEHATRLAATGNRVCAVDDGHVLCWGAAFSTKDGSNVGQTTPKLIGDDSDVVEVAVGFPHVCVIHRDRRVTCRAVYPTLSGVAIDYPQAGPATEIFGEEDDQFFTTTPNGPMEFKHAPIASGAAVLGTQKASRVGGAPRDAEHGIKNKEDTCRLGKDRVISCGGLTITIGVPPPAVAPDTLPPELGSRDAMVVDAKLDAEGQLSLCLALGRHRDPWVTTNRRCFALIDGKLKSVARWETTETATPNLGSEWEDASIHVSPSGRAAMAVLDPDENPRRHHIAFFDLAAVAPKLLWKRELRWHLDEGLYMTNDFVVYAFGDQMSGPLSLQLFSRNGALLELGPQPTLRHAPHGELHAGFSQASPRYVATWPSEVVLHSLDRPNERTGFTPPSADSVVLVLYDETRQLLYAVADQPLGAVTVFDRKTKRVIARAEPQRK